MVKAHSKTTGKSASPLPLKMRGLYQRGKVFWYRRMVDGARMQTNLETEDQGEAGAKVLAMRQHPDLVPINSYIKVVKGYVREQVIRGKLSHMFAPTRESSLRQFAVRVFMLIG